MGQKKDTNNDRFKGWHGGVVLEPSLHYESLMESMNPGLMQEQRAADADARSRINDAMHAEYED